ncbi:MAG TPA: ATP-binding protein [Clostridiales bacterium]|nr:ATP-binding protein [Clostridiales bacterium]
MMTELSLNVLDIANNSISANASLIEISIKVDNNADTLSITIYDNGCGMTKEQLNKVTDPFYTTRTTRGVGLGIPFFRQEAIDTGGSFNIASELGEGTTIDAVFGLSHIDRMPLGDINSTIFTLVIMNPHIDFLYTYEVDDDKFQLDTREFKSILGDIPFDNPDVSTFIKSYLAKNKWEVDNHCQV